MKYHSPVLLQATIHLLDIKKDHLYVDATLGGGGHTSAILDRGGKVLGLDQDSEAILACSTLYKKQIESGNLSLVQSNFTHLQEVVKNHNWSPISGILFDLGVSSHQFDTPERGFSFQKSGNLDMRMDTSTQVTAGDIVNTWPEKALADILKRFGELANANTLAKSVVMHRPLTTTSDLAAITKGDIRQAFQALRIAVNDELTSIETSLDQALAVIASGGCIAVISFHSLEDRIIKQTFLGWSTQGLGTIVTPSPITPTLEEIAENSRSKSAKLRVFKHI